MLFQTPEQERYNHLSVHAKHLVALERTESLEASKQEKKRHAIFIQHNSVYDVMQTPELTYDTRLNINSTKSSYSALYYALSNRAYAVALYLMSKTDTLPKKSEDHFSLLELALEYIVLPYSLDHTNNNSQLEQALLCFEVLISKGLDPLKPEEAKIYFKNYGSLSGYVQRSVCAITPEEKKKIAASQENCLAILHNCIEKAQKADYRFDFDAYLSKYPQPNLTQPTDAHRAEAAQFLARSIPEKLALAAHNRDALLQSLSLATEEGSDWEKPNIPAVTALTNASGPGLMRSSSPSMEDWEIVDAPSKSTSPILGD